jgi:hypothetical protein
VCQSCYNNTNIIVDIAIFYQSMVVGVGAMTGENEAQAADDGALVLMQAAVLSSISLFDQKSAVLLGFDWAACVFCLTTGAGFPAQVSIPFHTMSWADGGLIGLAFLFFVSAVFAFVVIWPRAKRTSDDLLYWRVWPTARTRKTFVAPTASPAEWATAKSYHIALLGNICRQKLRFFRIAMGLAYIAFIGLLVIEVVRF